MKMHLFRGDWLSEQQIAHAVGYDARAIQRRAYRLKITFAESAELGLPKRDMSRVRNRADWDVDVEQFISDHPDGAELAAIGDVFGVTRQAIDIILKSALAKLAFAHQGTELHEWWTESRLRAPSLWQQILSEAPQEGTWSATTLYGAERPLSAEAAAPSDYTRRVDEAISQLERSADRALLAALTQCQ